MSYTHLTEIQINTLIKSATSHGIGDVVDRIPLYLKRACIDLDIDFLSIEPETKESILQAITKKLLLTPKD